MYTYFLCDDNETVYKLEFSINGDEKDYYLSMLNCYLNELIFIEESEIKKLIEKDKIDEENKEKVFNKEGTLFFSKTEVANSELIEDYLPYIITLKTKKYYFLRPYTITLLLNLLSKEITSNSRASSLLEKVEERFIMFDSIYNFFFDKAGKLKKEKYLDYTALCSLFERLDINIYDYYHTYDLRGYFGMDDADRAVAEGILEDSAKNKQMLKILNQNSLKFNIPPDK